MVYLPIFISGDLIQRPKRYINHITGEISFSQLVKNHSVNLSNIQSFLKIVTFVQCKPNRDNYKEQMKKYISNHIIVFDNSGNAISQIQEQNQLLNDSLGLFQAFNILIKDMNKSLSLGNLVKINPQGLSTSQIQKIIDLGEQLNISCYYNQKQNMEDQIFNACNPIDMENVAQPILDNQTLYDSVREMGFSGISAIGDIHGDHDRMYEAVKWAQKNNHFIVLLGDLFNYGNQNFKVLDLAYQLIVRSEAVMCRGNHDIQLFYNIISKKTNESAIHLSSFIQYKKLSNIEQKRVQNQLFTMINRSNWWWQANNITFVHAAWSPLFNNPQSQKDAERIAMFGFSEKIHNDWVQNHDWIQDIPEGRMVVVGHESVSKQIPQERTNSHGGKAIFLDTGCSKKGVLSTVDLVFAKDELRFRNFNRF
jgi:hypothetical protein